MTIYNKIKTWKLPTKITIIIGLLGMIFAGLSFLDRILSKLEFNHAQPKLTFDVQSQPDNKIYYSIEANNNHGCKIDRLFFKLDLPGTLDTFNLRIKQNVDNFRYNKYFRRGVGKDTISEDINFEIDGFYPRSYFDGYIHYKPPKERIEKHGYTMVYFPTPNLDLQDYLLYTIVYTYNGTTQTISDTFSLINVDYIKQDKLRREVQPLITKKSLKDCLNNKTTNNSDEFTCYIDNAIQHYVRNSDKYNKNDTLGIYYNIDTMLAGKNDTAFACTIIYITNDTLYQVNNFNSKWIFKHLDSYRKKFKKHLDL